MKALDVKIEGLTSAEITTILSDIQDGLHEYFQKSLVANDPATIFELSEEKVYSDIPIYKDDKSDTLYVLYRNKDKNIYALMWKGRVIYSHWRTTEKKIYSAIVEHSDSPMRWMRIHNPKFKEFRESRFANKSDSIEYDKKRNYDGDQKLLKSNLKAIGDNFVDTEFEHDNFLLVARRAALETKKGNEVFYEKVVKAYEAASWSGTEAFNRLYRTYLDLFGYTHSQDEINKYQEAVKKYKGFPWKALSHMGITDKSGYKTNLDRYVWKRAREFENTKDTAVIKKLELEYNKVIKDEFEPMISNFINLEKWEDLKSVVDKVQNLKKKLDALNAYAVKNDNYSWSRISSEMRDTIDTLQDLKESLQKIKI